LKINKVKPVLKAGDMYLSKMVQFENRQNKERDRKIENFRKRFP
jgi:hypothetical protein